jgi:hypothetical protein
MQENFPLGMESFKNPTFFLQSKKGAMVQKEFNWDRTDFATGVLLFVMLSCPDSCCSSTRVRVCGLEEDARGRCCRSRADRLLLELEFMLEQCGSDEQNLRPEPYQNTTSDFF